MRTKVHKRSQQSERTDRKSPLCDDSNSHIISCRFRIYFPDCFRPAA
jgi:hypothetical protein